MNPGIPAPLFGGITITKVFSLKRNNWDIYLTAESLLCGYFFRIEMTEYVDLRLPLSDIGMILNHHTPNIQYYSF